MLTEDYIMRMINQALTVVLIALGLKRARKFNEALEAFDQALEGLLGLDAHLAKQLDDSQLLAVLTFMGKLDVDRLLVLAEIYAEEAEVYTLQGLPEKSQLVALSSLRFYLEAALANDAVPNSELIPKIEMLRRRLAADALPLETRLALLDYLDRLLALDDDSLSAVELSRPDLLAAYSSLDSPDLH